MSRAEQELQNIIAKQADGILIVQRDGTISLVNTAAEELLGRTQAELVGTHLGIPLATGETTVIDIVPAGAPAAAPAAVPKMHPGRVAEMRVVETEWDGRPVFLASIREITERARFLTEASTVLAGSLDFPTTLRSLAALVVRHLADGCIIDMLDDCSRDHRVIAHRDPAVEQQAAGLAPAHGPGERPSLHLARLLAAGRSEVLTDLAAAAGEGLPWQREMAFFRDRGCHSAMVVPMTAHGRTLGVIAFFKATGPRPFNQADLVIAEDLTYRAALALENARLYAEAQKAVLRRDEFLAMLAHELRNPLAPILQASYLLAQKAKGQPEVLRVSEVIQHQSGQMARLLDDLLDMSRITCGKITLRQRCADLQSILQSAIHTCQGLINESGHDLVVSMPWKPIRLHADPARLEQVFANLLNNAAKYTPRGGRIDLSARVEPPAPGADAAPPPGERPAAEAVVSVRDNGIGIAPEKLPYIFELFMQVQPALDRKQSGLGIGLTLVRSLVEMHGGTVSVRSEGLGRGSEFEVRLPLPAQAEEAAADPEAPRAPGRELRVLLVEDNPDARNMLAEVLAFHGHRVDAVADGPAAIERAVALRPDVALIDIGLPELDGYEVARRIRDRLGGEPMALVALTGYGQPEDRRQSGAAGFDAHLVKPVDIPVLLAEIGRLTAGREQQG